jgi:hypothetical protein
MKTILYKNKVGEGLIINDRSLIILSNQGIKLGNVILRPGLKTNLEGYWNKNLMYCGNFRKQLVFYIGRSTNLFDETRYYQVINYLAEDRFFSMFTHQSGRDYNYRNSTWK